MPTKRNNFGKLCIALFLGYALLAWLFPYTGDDWSWGSSIGMERLRIFFADYNGRYAGNLLVLVLTRSKLLDTVVMAASFLLACVLCHRYGADRSGASLLAAACLFLLMPREMWAQVAVWTAGFTNYVPSALIAVFFLVSAREITGREFAASGKALGKAVWMFALGFVGALFVESVTVFNICLGAAVIACMFLKFRKYRLPHIGFLLGSLAGALVMFSNGAYDRIAQGEDYYRHMPVGLRDTVYFALGQARIILQCILSDNFVFCVIVSAMLLTLALLGLKKGKTWALPAGAFHSGCLLLLRWEDAVSAAILNRFTLPKLIVNVIPVVAPLLYVLSILVAVLCLVEKGRRFHMLLPFYCAVVSLAPLLIVDPVGPRCVFIGYLFMMVFTVDLFGYLCKQIPLEEKWLSRGFALIVVAQLLFYCQIHYPVYYYDALRLDFIKTQAAEGKTEVWFCDLPNGDYLWTPTPGDEGWTRKYKLFYGLDEELKFVHIPYEELEALAKGES